MEKQLIHRFHFITHQGKHNGSVLERRVYGAVGATQISPMQNVWAAWQTSPKLVLTFECGNLHVLFV